MARRTSWADSESETQASSKKLDSRLVSLTWQPTGGFSSLRDGKHKHTAKLNMWQMAGPQMCTPQTDL